MIWYQYLVNIDLSISSNIWSLDSVFSRSNIIDKTVWPTNIKLNKLDKINLRMNWEFVAFSPVFSPVSCSVWCMLRRKDWMNSPHHHSDCRSEGNWKRLVPSWYMMMCLFDVCLFVFLFRYQYSISLSVFGGAVTSLAAACVGVSASPLSVSTNISDIGRNTYICLFQPTSV